MRDRTKIVQRGSTSNGGVFDFMWHQLAKIEEVSFVTTGVTDGDRSYVDYWI